MSWSRVLKLAINCNPLHALPTRSCQPLQADSHQPQWPSSSGVHPPLSRHTSQQSETVVPHDGISSAFRLHLPLILRRPFRKTLNSSSRLASKRSVICFAVCCKILSCGMILERYFPPLFRSLRHKSILPFNKKFRRLLSDSSVSTPPSQQRSWSHKTPLPCEKYSMKRTLLCTGAVFLSTPFLSQRSTLERMRHMLKTNTNTNTSRLESTTRRHDFTRLIEGKNREASNKANVKPHHRHSPSTSRFQRASRFASKKHLPKELTLDSNHKNPSAAFSNSPTLQTVGPRHHPRT